MNDSQKQVFPVFHVVILAMVVSLLAFGYMLAGIVKGRGVYAQQVSATSATIAAGMGSPVSLSVPCTAGMASDTTASLFLDRSVASGVNAVWRCAKLVDGVTYSWLAPYTMGNQVFYGASGLLAGGKCWTGSVTSNTSGQAAVSWATAGFTAPPVAVQLQPIGTTTTAAAQVWANPSGVTATGANITVTTPSTVVLGGLSVQLATVAYPISVLACGN